MHKARRGFPTLKTEGRHDANFVDMAAQQVGIMTTCWATNVDKVAIVMALGFQRVGNQWNVIFLYWKIAICHVFIFFEQHFITPITLNNAKYTDKSANHLSGLLKDADEDVRLPPLQHAISGVDFHIYVQIAHTIHKASFQTYNIYNISERCD